MVRRVFENLFYAKITVFMFAKKDMPILERFLGAWLNRQQRRSWVEEKLYAPCNRNQGVEILHSIGIFTYPYC